MNITATNIGVDSGIIMVCDYDYLNKLSGNTYTNKKLKMGDLRYIPNGKYTVDYNIEKTYNGKINGIAGLIITSGKILIIDPCYVIGNEDHSRWTKWLKDNDKGDNINSDNAFVITKMGGDGEYTVNLTLNPMK